MALRVTKDGKALVFQPEQRELCSREDTAQTLRNLHGLGAVFALDTVGWIQRYQLFLRIGSVESGIGPRITHSFEGVQQAEKKASDWLQLKAGEYGLVQPLTLSDHTMLPIADCSLEDARDRWGEVFAALVARPDDLWPGKLGVRVVLRPAGRDWREHFMKTAPVGDEARGTNIDRERWADRAGGTPFHAQIQLLAICQDDPTRVDLAKADVARLAELVPALTGQRDAWKLGTSLERSMTWAALRSPIRSARKPTLPWPELKFLPDEGDSPYTLSAEEAAALWPAWMPRVRSRHRTPQHLTTTDVELPAAPEREGTATPARSDAAETRHDSATSAGWLQ